MIEPVWTNKILVSTPKMRSDSAFDRSVVYLYEESPQHVAGLVINKPTKTKLQRIFQVKGFKTINIKDLVYQGGPVNQGNIIMMHTDEWSCKNTLNLAHGVSITSDVNMLKKMHEDDQPKYWRVFSGLSIWSPGQLEGEINSKCWMTAIPTPELSLETPTSQIYEKAIEICSKQIIDKYI